MHERDEHEGGHRAVPTRDALGGDATAPAAGEGAFTASPADIVDQSVELTEEARAEDRRSFDALGRTWDLLPGVFSPALTSSTEFYTRCLPFPRAGSFLEIGCGAGVTSVQAALSGCAEVTAVDIGPAAVENTTLNARRHGAPQVRALVGDVFDAVPVGGYDLVFWAIPYVALPEDDEYPSDLSRSVFDIGYQCCLAYLAGARSVLAPGGRLFLGFGDMGYRAEMEAIATAHGWRPELVAAGRAAPDTHIEHQMFELHDTARRTLTEGARGGAHGGGPRA